MKIRDKKLNTIWQKIISDRRTIVLAEECRRRLGMPTKGFSIKTAEGVKWIDSMLANEEITKNHRWKYVMLFRDAIYNIFELKNFIPDRSLDNVLTEYILFGEAADHFWEVNATGCRFSIKSEKDKPTLFIEVSQHATAADIKKFINKNGQKLKMYQQLINKGRDQMKPKRLRISKNHDRDKLIAYLYQLTTKQLRERGGGDSKYKDIQISKIFKDKYGVKISEGAIRNVNSRFKKNQQIKV